MTKCIDAGSKYCPCYLALTNDCIACSQLRGENFCGCEWSGVCILNEYVNELKKVSGGRKYYKGRIIDRLKFKNGLVIIHIKTDERLVRNLNLPGAYVFLKGVHREDFFNTPMSIFKITSKESFYIAYQELGCKTKIIKDVDEIEIKGPYWNGILGYRYLEKVSNSKCLVAVRGIGQSSALFPIEKMVSNGNKVHILLDKGKLDDLYIYDFLKDFKNITMEELDLFSEAADKYINQLLKNNDYGLVFSGGSNMLHRKMSRHLEKQIKRPHLLVSNNGILSCGEGVCGACIEKIKDGSRVRLCKAIITPNKLY